MTVPSQRNYQPNEYILPHVYLTVINVVQMLMRIIWIVNDQSSTQPITVLVPVVTVIPECPLKWKLSEPI